MKVLAIVLICVSALFFGIAAMVEMVVADPASLPLEVFHALAPYNPRYSNSSMVDGVLWICPVGFQRVASPFGYRIHPIYGDRRLHRGIDLAAPERQPVYATRSGTVSTASYNDESGNYVMIDHGGGFSSGYLHMDSYTVCEGDSVYAGQIIGYVGSTGASTGFHLHFSIYYNGEAIDPAIYIDFYGTGVTGSTPETTPTTDPSGEVQP